jgi:hypothetical protein
MITPPLSICANPALTLKLATSFLPFPSFIHNLHLLKKITNTSIDSTTRDDGIQYDRVKVRCNV